MYLYQRKASNLNQFSSKGHPADQYIIVPKIVDDEYNDYVV
jgi:hypothetical protein